MTELLNDESMWGDAMKALTEWRERAEAAETRLEKFGEMRAELRALIEGLEAKRPALMHGYSAPTVISLDRLKELLDRYEAAS